jgi:Uma2 family endonuclease
MSQVLTEKPITPPLFTIHLPPMINLTDDQFFALCQSNRDLRLERNAQGDILIMPPTGGKTGNRNFKINGQLYTWTVADATGEAFDSSTGFRLPNGADRSPDAAWVSRSRLKNLTDAEKDKFLPLCPDFVIELLSPTDILSVAQAKMAEYIENGARLGWLLEPETRRVHISRPGATVIVLENVEQIGADPELPGFVLNLREIWDPNI